MEHLLGSTVTHADLVRTGLTPAEIAARVRDGHLTRIRHGVYGPVRELDPEDEHLRLVLATVGGVDASSVLSHQSAGILHGLPVPRAELGRVAMTRRTAGHGYAANHLRVYSAPLVDADVTVVGGLHVTSLARTAVDLARVLEEHWGLAACDAALRLGLTTEHLGDVLVRHGRLRGLPRARRLVALADGRAESPAESVSRMQMMRSGVPAPTPQFTVRDADGNWVARCDFGWEDFKLVGEVDGMGKYGALLRPGQTAEMAVRDEKRREEAIRDAGYGMVRWDLGLALQRDPFAARIRRAMYRQVR